MDPSNLTLAYVLIGVGFLALLGELLIPASGTLLLVALVCIVAGVGLTFYYDPSLGTITLVVVCLALPVLGGMLVRWWPNSPAGRRLFLSQPDQDATVASMPVNLELERLRGRCGQAVSDLRPYGVTDFDGWRVDTLTEGLMVEAGQWVRCVDVRSGHVIVRPVAKPTATDFEDLNLG